MGAREMRYEDVEWIQIYCDRDKELSDSIEATNILIN
jgi:hypothetical protein